MTAFASVTFQGAEALRARLEKMDAALRESALRSAGFAGAAILRDQAIVNAPLLAPPGQKGHPPPGTLKKSIIVKRIEDKCGPYKQTYYVTVRKGKFDGMDAYYALWVEFGHIYRAPGQALKGGRSKKAIARAAHIASGGKTVPAHPFMRPAFMQQKDAAGKKIKQQIVDRLQLGGT